MNMFFSNVSIEESGIFRGFTDYHSHILPGVDDGVPAMEESLSILSEYERLGVAEVCLTPHVMEDIPNTPGSLSARFAELKAAYDGPIQLFLASENMMDSLFLQRLSSRSFLPVGGGGLLMETSYFNPPLDMDGMVDAVSAAGYQPILAHPERYVYMDMADYKALKKKNVLFQMNIGSLAGCYGRSVGGKAEELLKAGLYDCVGTDLHSRRMLDLIVNAKVSSKVIKMLKAIL